MTDDNGTTYEVTGTVEMTYRKPLNMDTDWTAGRLLPDGEYDSIKFAGECSLFAGDRTTLRGTWEDHPQWGRQLKVESSIPVLDVSINGIDALLANDSRFIGIGPNKSKKILEFIESHGGEGAVERIIKDEVLLTHLKKYARLPTCVVNTLRSRWNGTIEENRCKVKLLSLGMKHSHASQAWSKFGNLSVKMLKKDPYLMAQRLRRMTLEDADRIAIGHLGFSHGDRRRLSYALKCSMSKVIESGGHTWIPRNNLRSLSNKRLKFNNMDGIDRIDGAIDSLIAENDLIVRNISVFGDVLCDTRLYESEKHVAKMLGIDGTHEPNPHINIDSAGDCWSRSTKNGKIPSEKQKEAVTAFLSHRVSAITGAAGCGKTFTISMIVDLCARNKIPIMLGAPTGKAAKRMQETITSLCNLNGSSVVLPQTIHKMLRYNGSEWMVPPGGLNAKVIVIDEVSMIDIRLMHRLEEAMRNDTAIVLVGDHNQLPSIGPGALMRDIVCGEICHVTHLDEVFRHAGVLKRNANEVLMGRVPPTSEEVEPEIRRPVWIVEDKHPVHAHAHMSIMEHYEDILCTLGRERMLDVQILSPMYKGGAGIDMLNNAARSVTRRVLWGEEWVPSTPLIGDRVIQTKNDYSIGIMNGDQGIVVGFLDKDKRPIDDPEEQKDANWIVIDIVSDKDRPPVEVGHNAFKTFRFSYAISVHKFQGSECPHIICAAHGGEGHKYMLTKSLLYTMVTRATKTLTLVGDKTGIHSAKNRNHDQLRRTLTAPMQVLRRITCKSGRP